ncbi:MAG: ATP-binding protein [Candidatus Nezhaarchaeales archaeon]
MDAFDPKAFVEERVEEIRRVVGGGRALVAASGGVDSTTCAVLTHMAIGDNLVCVVLDHAFMRLGEPERVAEALSRPPLSLPVKLERAQERFLRALEGLRDAEEKRKAFRSVFYETLAEVAKREGCEYLVQGTILADVIETKGGVKTQHNVLEQVGIGARELYGFRVVEPLAPLLKWQVREVARYLKIPPEVSERQPFPGPGLLVRVVGEVRADKLAVLKRATEVVEEELEPYRPSQYFAAILDNEFMASPSVEALRALVASRLGVGLKSVALRLFSDRATGVIEGVRKYGGVLAIKCLSGGRAYLPPLGALLELQREVAEADPSIVRVLYLVSGAEEGEGRYSIVIRAVETGDFLTAQVADVPWNCLVRAAERIMEACPSVSSVYYDVTPKPPATIEME